MIYVYQILDADGGDGGGDADGGDGGGGNGDGGIFEIEQAAGDPPLEKHPLTGQPVRLVHQPPHLAGQHNERHVRASLGDSANLARHGFARYEKDRSTGRYHKTAGAGPGAPETI
jgi:hypothetical protein